MSRTPIFLVCLLFALSQAQQFNNTYTVPYKITLLSACECDWKSLPIGPRKELPMCGTTTGDGLAHYSSAFMTLGITAENPKDGLSGVPLTPDLIDTYLVKHDGYKNKGNSVNVDKLQALAGIRVDPNIDFNELIQKIAAGSAAFRVKFADKEDKENDGVWGLLESVTCYTKETSPGNFQRPCSLCARLRSREGPEKFACTPTIDSYSLLVNHLLYSLIEVTPKTG